MINKILTSCLIALFIFSAGGNLKKRKTTKQLYLSEPACTKARKSDANASCSVVDFQIDKLLKDADTNKTLFFLVAEVPTQSVNIMPVASGPTTFPTSWGARGVSREPMAIAGTIPSDIQDDIVIITNTRIGFSSTTAKRVEKITAGMTEYAVPLLARNALLGGRTVIYQAITGGLPSTGDWDNVVVHFTDGTQQPVGGPGVQRRLAYSDLPSGGGGATSLGASHTTSFQIPTLSDTTLTVTTANRPVFHNIASLTGSGITNQITQSSVSNIARITITNAGYVNIVWEDEVSIVTSTAGGSGSTGELIWAMTHYDKDDNDLRSWVGEHAIEDPITSAINFPFSMPTGITPVMAGDYFTMNFAFNSSVSNRNVVFSLPADNPGLDERVEVIYFPLTTINTGPAGPRGPPGPAGPAGSGGDGRLIVLPSVPTDLTPYAHGQILAIGDPETGVWREVSGADTGERHIFKLNGQNDPSNSNNWGYSSTGDIYGELRTWDGGKVVTDSGIVRLELQDRTTDTGVLLLAKSKVTYADAPSDIYVLFYQNNTLGSSNYIIDNVRFRKQADNQAHDYTTYAVNSTEAGDVTAVYEDRADVTGFGLFTAVNVPQTDYTSNAFELHASKTLTVFDPPETGATIVTKLSGLSGASRLPATAVKDLPDAVPAYFNDVIGSETRSVSGSDTVTNLTTSGSSITDRSSSGILGDATSGIIFGGYSGFDAQFFTIYRDDFYNYNVSGNIITLTSLTKSGTIRGRSGFGMVGDKTSGIIFGGSGNSQNYNDFKKYEVSGNTVTITDLTVSGSISARAQFGMVGDATSGIIFQGLEPFGIPNDFKKYEVSGNTVTITDLTVSGSILARYAFGIVGDATSGIIFGGVHSDYVTRSNKFKKYEVSGNTVTITDLTVSGSISARSHFGMVGNKTSGIIFGGYDGNTDTLLNDFKKYEVSGNTVTITDIDFTGNITGRANPTMIGNATSGIIFGGDNNSSGNFKNDFNRYIRVPTSETTEGILLKSSLTPRRVTSLPAESEAKEGETVWLEADYSITNGVNITPQNFAGTELDSTFDADAPANIGSRGWYAKQDAGFQFGEVHPALPDNFVLISDTRVYVKRNTLTNLSKLHLGDTEYTITRVAQSAGSKLNSNPAYASSLPDVDYYTITGGLPAGDWDNLRFETTTAGTFIPASSTITKGFYEFKNSDWGRASYNAPPAQPDKDIIWRVEERRPGTRADKNLDFVASGSTFTISDPFPGILRITYNNLSTDSDTYQRFTVFVPLAGFEDSRAPAVLKIGSVNYSLSYFETDAGQAVYRSPIIKSSERISSASTVNGMNVQRADGSWTGQSGDSSVYRTVNKGAIQGVANSATGVHVPPTNPHEGTRIIMLNDYTIHGGAVLTAQESSGSDSRGTSITGLFTGYEKDSRYDNGSTGGDLGSLDPTNTNFDGLISFSNARAAGSEANKTMFVSNNGNTYTPRFVYINGVKYSVGSAVNRDFYPLTGLDGSFLKNGKQYYVNTETSAGARLYPDVVLKSGSYYIWNGLYWQLEKTGLGQAEVDARINNRVQSWARNPATGVISVGSICGKKANGDDNILTSAEFTALQSKPTGTWFCVRVQ